MGGYNVSNILDPVSPQDAATKKYVDTHQSYNASYITSTYNATNDAKTNYNASYWTGTNYNASYITSTFNATYDAKTNYNASYVELTNASYYLVDGSRALTGNMNAGSKQITSLITSASDGTSATNKTYVDTADATKAPAVNTAYITLMAGSGMMPTTNAAPMGQSETTTNKNNYIWGNFTDGGSENMQWIVDMPGDWDSTAATNGKLTFNTIWITAAGTAGQTVEWDYAGKLFPDNSVIDTALAAVGSSTDTLLAINNIHISPDSTAALVTSAGTGGRTMILKVTRNSGVDNLGATAQLIGVRIKYIRTIA